MGCQINGKISNVILLRPHCVILNYHVKCQFPESYRKQVYVNLWGHNSVSLRNDTLEGTCLVSFPLVKLIILDYRP